MNTRFFAPPFVGHSLALPSLHTLAGLLLIVSGYLFLNASLARLITTGNPIDKQLAYLSGSLADCSLPIGLAAMFARDAFFRNHFEQYEGKP